MINVFKIGGNVIDSEQDLDDFLKKFIKIKDPKILIHGGGKIATKIAKELGIETKMIDGKRITDREMLKVITMVYGGSVNKEIIAKLQNLGTNAMGLTGADGAVVLSEKRPVKEIDYGFVGDIKKVNSFFILALLNLGICPVFAPITLGDKGQLLNTNADTLASAIAVSLSQLEETNLIYCFEKNGVLENMENENSVIPEINKQEFKNLKDNKIIYEGMIPKLENAFLAIENGVNKVIICNSNDIDNFENSGTTLTS